MTRNDILMLGLPDSQMLYCAPPDRHPGGIGHAQARGYLQAPADSDRGGNVKLELLTANGVIDLGYVPRKWAELAHLYMSYPETRGLVLVAARQHGKTHLCCILLIIAALQQHGSYGYVAPRRITAKGVAWPVMKEYARNIPGVEFREGDLQCLIPCATAPGQMSTIHLFGAIEEESGSSARGFTLTGIVCDEAGQMGMDFLQSVLLPTQTAIEKPWMVVIGTPRGQADALYEMLKMAERTPGWHTMIVPISSAGVFDEERQKAIRATMSENAWLREYMCSFDVGTEDQLIRIEYALAAAERVLSERQHRELRTNYPLIAGLDIGLQRDRSVLVLRCGPAVLYHRSFEMPTTQQLSLAVLRIVREWNVTQLFVDVGAAGRAVCDVMRQLGLTPVEINFGGQPDDVTVFANKRAEMYDRMRAWIERDDSIIPPDDHSIIRELTASRFNHNQSNKMILERKKDVIARIGTSPDWADALALTFASNHVFNPHLDYDAIVPHHQIKTTGDELVERGPDGSRYSSARRTALHRDAHRSNKEFDPYDTSAEEWNRYD